MRLPPPLVGSFVMGMRHVFPQQVSDVALPQRPHPVQALLHYQVRQFQSQSTARGRIATP